MSHAHSHELVPGEAEARGGRFVLAIVITSLTLVAEVLGGILTGSLALLSDAAHVFVDILALGLSYAAVRLVARAGASLPSRPRRAAFSIVVRGRRSTWPRKSIE